MEGGGLPNSQNQKKCPQITPKSPKKLTKIFTKSTKKLHFEQGVPKRGGVRYLGKIPKKSRIFFRSALFRMFKVGIGNEDLNNNIFIECQNNFNSEQDICTGILGSGGQADAATINGSARLFGDIIVVPACTKWRSFKRFCTKVA